MTRNVLVTGAGGFVGRHVLRELLSRGHAVTLAERSSHPVCLDGEAEDCRRLQTDDLFAERQEWWADACTGIDTVIHLAWFAVPGRCQRAVENLACVEGTIRLARGAAQAGVSRFVGIGTCAEYDVSQCLLSTDTPLRPLTLYGSSKAASFLLLSSLLAELNVSFAWCRLFYLYGAGEHEDRLLPYVRSRLAAGQSGNWLSRWPMTMAVATCSGSGRGPTTTLIHRASWDAPEESLHDHETREPHSVSLQGTAGFPEPHVRQPGRSTELP